MDHMSCLSALGHTIVASIHQPRAGIWDMLHKVCSEPEIAKRMSLRLLCPSKADQLPEHHGPHVLPHSPGHTAVAFESSAQSSHLAHAAQGGWWVWHKVQSAHRYICFPPLCSGPHYSRLFSPAQSRHLGMLHKVGVNCLVLEIGLCKIYFISCSSIPVPRRPQKAQGAGIQGV